MLIPLLLCSVALLSVTDITETTTGEAVAFKADDTDPQTQALVSISALLERAESEEPANTPVSLKAVIETSPDGELFLPVGAVEITGLGKALNLIPVKVLLAHVRVRLEVRGPLKVSAATVRLHTNEELRLVESEAPSAPPEA